ncbi:MAG: ribosome assembly RNA-binding protein YhbY [Nitrosomonas sp.]|nr:MAG: ribosome assembly RNA-binding protein YhbY [Nitrosomonas sp.]
MLTLTVSRRRELKALAHSLNPVVMIGKSGLSASVIDELDRAILKHELIKIKVQMDDRAIRNALLEQICQHLNAAFVQHIGKILVIYRPKPQDLEKKPTSRTDKPRKSTAKNTKRKP